MSSTTSTRGRLCVWPRSPQPVRRLLHVPGSSSTAGSSTSPLGLVSRRSVPCSNAGPRPLDAVELLPPVPDPVHVIGVGLNTRSHADEVARWRGTEPEASEYPRLFLRSPASQ